MTPTRDYVQRRFDEFNALCFGGELLPIPVRLSRARSFLGQIAYRRERRFFGRDRNEGFVLRISTLFDLPQDELDDVILHEMIHYSILSRQLKDASTHGPLFRSMMDDINRRFGRHITVSHRRTAEDNARDTAVRQHLVCRVHFRDGRTGLTVAAHTRLLPLWDALAHWPEVSAFRWFVSRDPFFNRFPRSKVLKVYRVDDAELEEHLRSAVALAREGNTVKKAASAPA